MLAEERAQLHVLPADRYAPALDEERLVHAEGVVERCDPVPSS